MEVRAPVVIHQVDIDVERPLTHRLGGQPGLLGDLPGGRRPRSRVVRLYVPTGLQPPPQLAVQDQQQAVAIGVQDEGTGGDVTGVDAIAIEGVGGAVEQGRDEGERLPLAGVGGDHSAQRSPQGRPVHQARSRLRASRQAIHGARWSMDRSVPSTPNVNWSAPASTMRSP